MNTGGASWRGKGGSPSHQPRGTSASYVHSHPKKIRGNMSTQPTLALLCGLPVSHVWFGHGSALFLELGALSRGRAHRDGSTGNSKGEVTVIADFGWRIERIRSILGGSGDSKKALLSITQKLLGATVLSAQFVGRVPELELQFSNGLWLVTFSHYAGQPTWAVLFGESGEICIKGGRLKSAHAVPSNSYTHLLNSRKSFF